MKRMELTVTRTVPATPAEVYDVWLDPKSPGGPFFGATKTIVNAFVDGLFYQAMTHEGRTWTHYGLFVRLERPRAIEHTWVSESTHGIESKVSLTFEPQGDDTLVTLRHRDLPDDEDGRQHEEGWKFVLGSLAEVFAKKKKA
jgi:uncharacterized protein YndB with AHSA1/START domain